MVDHVTTAVKPDDSDSRAHRRKLRQIGALGDELMLPVERGAKPITAWERGKINGEELVSSDEVRQRRVIEAGRLGDHCVDRRVSDTAPARGWTGGDQRFYHAAQLHRALGLAYLLLDPCKSVVDLHEQPTNLCQLGTNPAVPDGAHVEPFNV